MATRRTELALVGTLLGCHPAPPDPPRTGPVVVASEGLAADLAATQAFSATRASYERPLGVGLEGPGGLALSAESCAACHAEIAAEWRLSIHAQAWIDPQYQGEISKSGNRWMCLNCHTPLLVQQELWPRSLQDGDVERPVLAASPAFDEAFQQEGISCTSCHLRETADGPAIAGPGLGGTAPHPVVVDPDLRSGRFCERCHDAQASYPEKSFICTFWTGHELRDGPWDDEGATCVTCHMPTIERPAAIGGPVRTVARHWWRGAGIPKIEGRYPPPEANVPGLGLTAAWTGDALELQLANARAGHMLPTGDPERWVQVDVTFYAGDQVIGTLWSTRIGQQWEWSAPPRKLADNRLAPRESRTVSVPAPDGATRAVVEASSHRISKENADYHQLTDYPRSVTTHHLDVAR